MRMQSLRWNLVVWEPSAGPADSFGAPTFAYFAWTVRSHWRPIFLVTGVLLMVAGLMLPSAVAFVAGMLVVGLSVPATRSHSPTAAMVRAWASPRKGQADHR
jgi:hypothetical protein